MHDAKLTDDLIRPDDAVMFGDKGYVSNKRKRAAVHRLEEGGDRVKRIDGGFSGHRPVACFYAAEWPGFIPPLTGDMILKRHQFGVQISILRIYGISISLCHKLAKYV